MRTHRTDTVPVNDRRAMHTYEYLWIQQLLEFLHGAAQHQRIAGNVDTHIVACGIYPVDFLDDDAVGCAAVLYRQPARESIVTR